VIVAVTGATEHIGLNVVRALVARRQEVRALIPGDSHNIRNLGIETLKGDTRDTLSLCRAFAGAEVVYHAASFDSRSQTYWPILDSINIGGARNVVEACLQCGVKRLVHFSSFRSAVQEPLDVPMNEQKTLAEAEECQVYDRSMAAAEREIRKGIEMGLDAVMLNPTCVIGPYDHQPSQLGEVLLALAQGKLNALVDEGFDWVDVRDVAQAALRAQEVAPTGAKYFLSGTWTSSKELARLVGEISGKNAPRLVVPAWLARSGTPVVTAFNQMTRQRLTIPNLPIRDFGNCNSAISHKRASDELNYHPRPLKETLAETFKWYQEAGILDRSLRLRT
jgi:dihydroflavonol-4-reductase